MVRKGFLEYIPDDDNVRHGLNKDLGFSAADRVKNTRRTAETAQLFADAGIVVITSLILPYRVNRDFAGRIHVAVGLIFLEIYMDTPLAVRRECDPKGLYAMAGRGQLRGFTGIDDPYEPPLAPGLVCRTAGFPLRAIVSCVIEFMVKDGFLDGGACTLRPMGADSP